PIRLLPPSRTTPAWSLFPYTTLFRSSLEQQQRHRLPHDQRPPHHQRPRSLQRSLRLVEKPDAPRRRAGTQARATHGKRGHVARTDRKSTRLNSSHQIISYAVFCLKNK